MFPPASRELSQPLHHRALAHNTPDVGRLQRGCRWHWVALLNCRFSGGLRKRDPCKGGMPEACLYSPSRGSGGACSQQAHRAGPRGGRTLFKVEGETPRNHRTIYEIRRSEDTWRVVKEGKFAAAWAVIWRHTEQSSTWLWVPVLGCLIREKAKARCQVRLKGEGEA